MSYFDSEYYYNFYNDIKKANITTRNRLLRHWIRFGFKENRVCNKIFENINLQLLKKELKNENLLYFENIFNILLKEYTFESFNITNEYIINRFNKNNNKSME